MAEAILARSGMVPQTRTINGLPLSGDITLNDTRINAGNGVYFDTLRNILSNNTVHKYDTQTDTTILNDANYPYSYEALVNSSTAEQIGLVNNGNWYVVKYLRNTANNGYGIQLAFNHITGAIFIRSSTELVWNPWQTVYTSGNLNPGVIGAAAASHSHWDEEIQANNGVVVSSLRDILVSSTVKKIYRINDTGILNNPNYAYPYETSVADYNAANIGLPGGLWWHIKYFRHDDNNGFGSQIAIGLNSGNRMLFRTSNGTNWYQWQEVYHSGNFDPSSSGKTIQGSYVGENEYEDNTTKTRFINLGVTPKAVFVMMNGTSIHDSNYNNLGGMALQGIPCKTVANNVNYNIIEIVQNGFNVFTTMKRINTNWWLRINTNSLGNTYFYIAFI